MRPLIPYFSAAEIDVFGGFSLKPPGLLLAIGLVAGSMAALSKARRDGLHVEWVLGFLPWLFLALLLGSHFADLLLYRIGSLKQSPMGLLRVWEGESSAGAIVAAAAAGTWFFRRKTRNAALAGEGHVDPWSYADVLVYGAAIGWFFGRLGCFIVHDHPGVETRFWFAVYGICPSRRLDVACHDLGLDEAGLSLALFLLLKTLDQKPRFPGYFVATSAIVYGVSRLLLDQLRHPLTEARYLDLTPAQYVCVALLAVAAHIIMKRRAIRAPIPVADLTR